MKRNVNVFIGVVLCAVLCGCFVWLSTVSEDDAWSPNEIYNEIVQKSSYSSSYTNATFSASSGDGLALSMGSSSLSRARKSVSYAGAHGGAVTTPLTSNLSPLTYTGATAGAGMHLTSNAQLKSFGGGGNAVAMGGSARSAAMSNSQSPVAHGAMGMSPITYTAARVKNTPSVDPATVSSGDMMAVMAANYGMGGYASLSYGSTLQGAYDQYAGVYGASTTTSWGISGRRNSSDDSSSGNTNSILDWFYRYGFGFGTGTGSDEDGWIYTFSREQLQNAYNEYINNYWDPMWGITKPSFEEWLAWMENGGDLGYEYNGNWYKMAPVGDIIPLLLLALLYVLFVAIKSKSFQSLLKTERSE